MSDRYIPLGKYVPPTPRYPVQRVPNFPQTEGAGDLSFQQVMDREQSTSAQLKAIPRTTFTRTAQSANPPVVQPIVPMQNGKMVVTELPANGNGVERQKLEESAKLIDSMSTKVPNQKKFEDEFAQNIKEYQALKAQNDSKNTNTVSTLPGNTSPISNYDKAKSTPSPSQPSPKFGSGLGRPTQIQSVSPQQSEAQAHVSGNENQKYAFWSASSAKEQTSPVKEPASFNPDRIAHGTVRNKPMRNEVQQTEINRTSQTKMESKKIEVEDNERKGITGAVSSFFGDLLSGLTLGFYRPGGEEAPEGVARIVYPFKKLVYDAPVKDLMIGVPTGVYHSAGSVFDKDDEEPETKNSAPVAESQPEERSRKYRRRFSLDYAVSNYSSRRRSA